MYLAIAEYTKKQQVTLVAVSKTQSIPTIMTLYNQGQRIFGENRVQELVEKYEAMPKDIQWHLIGHLQKNKVKYIAPFVSMIHSVDSFELLEVINQQAKKNDRIIPVLLQFHIAEEETKFGLNIQEAQSLLEQIKLQSLDHIKICGVMGMASFTDDKEKVRGEFRTLNTYFDAIKTKYFSEDAGFKEISMGMSGDYEIAISEGSTMVRIGSALFG
jgi:PLP dependent protein